MESFMTVLDTSIPYEKVLMVMARKTIRKEIELNQEFHYVEFDESLKEAWCKLQTEVCLFENLEEARKKWDSMLTRDKDFFSKHFLFVANENNELVGSAGLWFGNDFEEKFTYTYNSDGTVSVNEYQGTIGSPTLVPSSPYTYTFTNNELTADDDSIFVYEDKNNPFMNVTGFKELMLPEFADDYMIAFGRNKMMTSTYDESNTSEGIFATHTYNSSNFPTSSVINANFTLGSFIGTVNVQYFYN